jgi:hypothetical protein
MIERSEIVALPYKEILFLSWLLFCIIGCYSAKNIEDSSTPKDGQTVALPDANKPKDIDSSSDRPKTDSMVTSDAPTDAQVDRTVDTNPPLPRIPVKHRAAAETCDNIRDVPEPDPAYYYEGRNEECRVHADCNQGSNGRCGMNRDVYYCTYDACFNDSDCGEFACICGGDGANRCMTGNCQVDADCGANGFCSPSFGDCGSYSGVVAYYCHTPQDECTDDIDCGGTGEGMGSYCAYNPVAGKWMCSNSQCVG